MAMCSLRCHHINELCQTQHTTTMKVFNTLSADLWVLYHLKCTTWKVRCCSQWQ